MSVALPLSNFTLQERTKLLNDLKIYGKETKYNKYNIPFLEMYEIDEDNNILLPFAYVYHYVSKEKYGSDKKSKKGKKELKGPNDHLDFEKCNKSEDIKIKLRDYQEEIKKIVYEVLNRTRSNFLALNCAFGKSYFSLYLSKKLDYKTAIVLFKTTLEPQWYNSIKTISPESNVQIVKGKKHLDPDADFYIIGAKTCVNREDFTEFSDVGLLIIDEAHMLYSEKHAKVMFKFQPKYLIGLSATPFKTNGINGMLEYYFGPEFLFKELYRPFNVYTYFTDFVPKSKQIKNDKGKLDWNLVLDSVSENEEIQNLIIYIIQFFSNRNILVLTKRVEKEGQVIYDKLKEIGENVDIYVGNSKRYNYDSRVLVSTCSKSGVGFDNVKLDMLLLASDVEEGIEQYLGRVFRKEDTIPMVVDIVHYKFRPLYKHWETRKKLYERCGGDIKDLNTFFPEFQEYCESN